MTSRRISRDQLKRELDERKFAPPVFTTPEPDVHPGRPHKFGPNGGTCRIVGCTGWQEREGEAAPVTPAAPTAEFEPAAAIPTPADAAARAARVVAGNGGRVQAVGGPPAPVANPPTEKQVAFLRRLANERQAAEAYGLDATDTRTIAEVVGDALLDETIAALDKRAASRTIDAWLTLPVAPATVPDDGPAHETAASSDHLARGRVHVLEIDGRPTYVRVHVSQRTGKPYAATANLEHGLEWEYAPGLVRRLRPATLVTPEQAKEFGDLTERCVFCSTPIDTPESTAVGYGPVCAEKNGLPWG